MKVFSFCIYGTEKNYYNGLLENIQIIREYFPEFTTYVYKGICDPEWKFEGVEVIETNKEGVINMLYRYLPLTFADIGFIRDADSRITERDRWCISEFLKSDKLYHIIRDHYFHKEPIMGGIFGWKKPIEIDLNLSSTMNYSDDMTYLKNYLYPLVKQDSLVHTNIYGFAGEHVELIQISHKDAHDFIGNVIWDNVPRFQYFVGDVFELLNFLHSQKHFILVKHHMDGLKHAKIPYELRNNLYILAYNANYILENVEECKFWLSKFEFAEYSLAVYQFSNLFFNIANKKVIASFDPEREPNSDEIVVVYGNYPDAHNGLPYQSKIFRHASMFFDIKHDKVEYHPSWEFIKTIYILNLEDRPDRYSDTLISLCSVRAPLHRVHHYKAKKDGLPPYIGATKNHVDVIKHFVDSGNENCLILEDDIVFIDDRKKFWNSFLELTKRHYGYTLCFLAISKIGQREELDELLSITKQECTTSSAYLLQKSTAQQVLNVASEGLSKMTTSGDHHTYCIDRYWCSLLNNVFFRHKLAYQRPSYSNLTKQINFNLD
jgi:hypothetical protein